MSADKQKVLNILEMRFDYQSSRNVFHNWHKTAGIREEQDILNDEDLKSLLNYLKENVNGIDRVQAAIERMILSSDEAACEPPCEAPAEEIHVDETPAEEIHVDETPAEEIHVDETPAEEIHVDETPAEVAPADENYVEESSSEDTHAEEEKAEENHSDNGKKKKKSKR